MNTYSDNEELTTIEDLMNAILTGYGDTYDNIEYPDDNSSLYFQITHDNITTIIDILKRSGVNTDRLRFPEVCQLVNTYANDRLVIQIEFDLYKGRIYITVTCSICETDDLDESIMSMCKEERIEMNNSYKDQFGFGVIRCLMEYGYVPYDNDQRNFTEFASQFKLNN